MLIQVLQVFKLDVEFEITIAFRDLVNELRDVGLQVNEQIGRLHEVDHRVVNVQVALVVAVVDVPAIVQVGSEYVSVLIYGPILNHRFSAFTDETNLVETTVKEIDLQVERPPGHVGIEIPQVGIVIDRFKQ